MESRFKRLVLTCLLAASALLATLATSVGAATDGDPQHRDVLDDVISPDLERRRISDEKIDTENLEIGFFAGVLSVEDFGSNDVYGVRLALYVTEDVFLESTLGLATLQKTSYELLSGDTQLLSEDDRELVYFSENVGINLFPGEVYLGRRAFNSNFYVIGGAGNTHFAGNEYFTLLFGGGFRLFASDWLSLHVGFRNHLMEHSIFGETKKIQNLESHIGLSLFL